MRIMLLLVALIICGCDSPDPVTDYACNEDQMRRVEHETQWNIEHKIHEPWFAYRSAIKRNCTEKTTK